MNFKQRTDILTVLYSHRNDVFREPGDSDRRTRLLCRKQAEIVAFKELTEHTLDELPKVLQSFDENDDKFTSEEWMSEDIRGCAFVPSDGSGCWATEEGYSWDHGDVFETRPSWATHVAWFNN